MAPQNAWGGVLNSYRDRIGRGRKTHAAAEIVTLVGVEESLNAVFTAISSAERLAIFGVDLGVSVVGANTLYVADENPPPRELPQSKL